MPQRARQFMVSLLAIIAICGIGSYPAFANNYITSLFLILDDGGPITATQTIRLSLWSDGRMDVGDISGGSLNLAAPHYAGYKIEIVETPDSLGRVRIALGSLDNFPEITPANQFLMIEYKDDTAPASSYQTYTDLYINNTGMQRFPLLIGGPDIYRGIYDNRATDRETFTLDFDNTAGSGDQISLVFGNALSRALVYDIDTDLFRLDDGSGGRAQLSFELETVNALPGGGGGIGAVGSGRIIHLTATDMTAPGCTITPFCGAGTYVWNGSTWISLTGSTSANFNKLVTVGSSGADYTTIAGAAIYLNTLSGGIILLSAETHTVNSSVDLENIILIGKDPSRTTIEISGSGQLDTFDTVFEQLTLDIKSITDTMALDVQQGSNSLRFSFVDIKVLDSGDSLIDSNAVTAPTVSIKFIKTNMVGSGNGVVLKPIASGNLNAASEIFIDSRSSDNPLQVSDWNVILAGGGSVNTTGIITSIPAQSIIVSPQMNLQGAIDSLEAIGNGGLITLLPGTHSITSSLTIHDSNIQIQGYGDASIISASGITGGTTVAAIQVGAANGSTPVNGVVLKDFKLEVTGTGATDIHGIRVTGGEDNRVDNVTVQKVSGQSGSGATARMGIQFIDGTLGCSGTCVLTRPVIIKSRVFGNGGSNYFTDGIHVTSDPAVSGVFGNGQGITNALLDGNSVDYVRETAYVFYGVSNSALFNNRASRMGAGGGAAYGIYMGNMDNINMSANVFSGSLSTGSIAIGVEALNTGTLKTTQDSLFTNNVIDGMGNGGVGFGTSFQIGATSNTNVLRNTFRNNAITGASSATTFAFNIRGNADDNSFSDNSISGGANSWNTGINLISASQERNLLSNNQFENVTTLINDLATASRIDVTHHRATTDPTVNDDRNDGYKVGTIWINTTAGTSYILVNDAVGAAVWNQIDAAGGGGGGGTDYLFGYDTNNQAVATANTFQTITFNNPTAVANGWSYSAGDFTVPATGLYRIDFTAHVGRTNNNDTTATIRATRNGTEIAGSAAFSSASRRNRPVPLTNSFIGGFTAGDLLRFQLTASATGQSMGLFLNNTAGTTQPTITVTITRIN